MNKTDLLPAQAKHLMRMNQQLSSTLEPLYDDLNFALAEWRKFKDNQFWRRTLIRCMLAVIEALLWNMKNMVPQLAQISGVQLAPKDLQIVNERLFVTTGSKIEQKKKFLPFRDNVKATFALFAKVHRGNYSMRIDRNFDALCNTYELRSRLMHPKKPSDPIVSDDDIRESQRGMDWLKNEYAALINACEAAVAKIYLTGLK